MDQKSTDLLNSIQNKDMHELTPEDKAFLRARSSYLGKRAHQKYADILAGKDEVVATPLTEGKQEAEDSNTFPGEQDEDGDIETIL